MSIVLGIALGFVKKRFGIAIMYSHNNIIQNNNNNNYYLDVFYNKLLNSCNHTQHK